MTINHAIFAHPLHFAIGCKLATLSVHQGRGFTDGEGVARNVGRHNFRGGWRNPIDICWRRQVLIVSHAHSLPQHFCGDGGQIPACLGNWFRGQRGRQKVDGVLQSQAPTRCSWRKAASRGLSAEKRNNSTRSAGTKSSLIYIGICPMTGE